MRLYYLSKKQVAVFLIAGLVFIFGFIFVNLSWFSGVPVLNYHQINNEAHNVLTLSDREFEAQIAYLYNSGYTPISPKQLVDYLQGGKELPSKPILITFDDGYADNYRVAYPILKKYHFKATIFLITDFVGNNDRYLNWQQVKEMGAHGISFESHTLSHIDLTKASNDELYAQLLKSREAMENQLGQKIEYLAYPGGAYDHRVIKVAKEAGYKAAFTINLGRDMTQCELFTLNRIPVFEGSHTFLHFWLRLKFTQAVSALQNLKIYLQKNGATFIANLIYVP